MHKITDIWLAAQILHHDDATPPQVHENLATSDSSGPGTDPSLQVHESKPEGKGSWPLGQE